MAPVFLSFLWSNLASILVIGFTSYSLYMILYFVFETVRKRRAFRGFPEPQEGKHWFWGHMLLFSGRIPYKDRIARAMKFMKEFPRFYAVRIGPGKINVVLHHPETIKVLLKGTDPKPTNYGGAYRHAIPWLGEGLLIASGKRWARSRRLLTPAFHFDILKPYINVYNECSEQFLDNIKMFVKSGRSFEVFNLVSLCTLDIILRCAFSYKTDCQKNSGEVHPYVKAVHEISETWSYRNRSMWLHPDFIFYLTAEGKRFKRNCNYVHGVAEEVISHRQKSLEKIDISKRRYLDFLDILLTAKDENGIGLTSEEIRNEVDTFLFEGHDTTASSISWILHSLAVHPEYQRKCQHEIDAILDGREDDNLTWDDLSKVEYLTMCIKEGMRLHGPVPFIQRQIVKPLVVDGYTIPPGTSVTANILLLHNNPTVWDEPSVFNPERFSKDNIDKKDSFAFLPFSAGPRNCIGQHFALNEEKTVLAKLLRRFNFKLDPTHVVEKEAAAVMRAKNGIYMYAEPRQSSH